MEKMAIELIPVSKLHPHPDNPRKDIGDIAELTESIRKNGIMQNLTVVPDAQGEYTVIIGYRRRAAALAAGLEEVPCAVADLSDSEQVLMMLEENMHRADLTPIEQAYGFQMMFDFGLSADEIADRTGFHRATVYHRLNIAKLDRDVLEKKQNDEEFQLTIKDLILLEQIDDVEVRNNILKRVRKSSELQWEVNKEARLQRCDKSYAEFEKYLLAAGLKDAPAQYNANPWSSDWKVVATFDLDIDPSAVTAIVEEAEKSNKIKNAKFFARRYDEVRLIKKAEPKKEKIDPKKARIEKAEKEIDEAWDEMKNELSNTVRFIVDKNLKADKEQEAITMLWALALHKEIPVSTQILVSFLADSSYWNIEEEEKRRYTIIAHQMNMINQLLVMVVASTNGYYVTFSDDGKFTCNDYTDFVEQFITVLEDYWPVKISRESKALMDGTHEAYIRDDE